MRRLVKCTSVIMVVSATVSCSGGNGGGDDPSFDFSVVPTSLVGSQYEGDASRFIITSAIQDRNGVLGDPYFRITNQSGAIALEVSTLPSDDGEHRAAIRIPSALVVGRYQGDLHIDACNDVTCRQVYRSRTLPYDITVLSGENLTPLSSLTGASDWTSRGGNAGHSGYVPVSLDSSKFSVRWTRPLPPALDQIPLTDPVTAKGHVIFSRAPLGSGSSPPSISGVYALKESDGALAWSISEFSGSPLTFSAPATDGNTVWVLRPGLTTHGSYDGASSSLDWISADNGWLYAQILYPNYLLPSTSTVVSDNGQILAMGMELRELMDGSTAPVASVMSYDALSTAKQWASNMLSLDVTSDVASVFAYPGGSSAALGLQVVSRASGVETRVIDDPQFDGPGADPSPLVVAQGHVVFSYGGLLKNFSPEGMIRWQIPTDFDAVQLPSVAIANGAVYFVQSGRRLSVLSADSGAELWSWTPDDSDHTFHPDTAGMEGTPVSAPIVTNTHVFVSTFHGVHAVSLATRLSEWFYPHPARMAISANGVLYLMRAPLDGPMYASDGHITAINLH
ncbi:MAG TPA: PQQ-binding-like beta-propeller repeat protein [Vicinamibacterales bacterium]|nr:PQQ-binding-like beta-propeller repeat protein [Vicinamibacterales bacterium]